LNRFSECPCCSHESDSTDTSAESVTVQVSPPPDPILSACMNCNRKETPDDVAAAAANGTDHYKYLKLDTIAVQQLSYRYKFCLISKASVVNIDTIKVCVQCKKVLCGDSKERLNADNGWPAFMCSILMNSALRMFSF
jgi:hypothetical protein